MFSSDCPKCGDLDKDNDPFSTSSYFSVLSSTEETYHLSCNHEDVDVRWEETRQCKCCGTVFTSKCSA
jgi:hypothetical protein